MNSTKKYLEPIIENDQEFLPFLVGSGANVSYSTQKSRFVKLDKVEQSMSIMMGGQKYPVKQVGIFRLGAFTHPTTKKEIHLDLPGVFYMENDNLVQDTIINLNKLVKGGFLTWNTSKKDNPNTYDVGLPGSDLHFHILERDELIYVCFSKVYQDYPLDVDRAPNGETALELWERNHIENPDIKSGK